MHFYPPKIKLIILDNFDSLLEKYIRVVTNEAPNNLRI